LSTANIRSYLLKSVVGSFGGTMHRADRCKDSWRLCCARCFGVLMVVEVAVLQVTEAYKRIRAFRVNLGRSL
jgi:hypothetical protein